MSWSRPAGRIGWHAIVRWLRTARGRRRQRIDLAALDDHLLQDIGLTRDVARAEVAKPWWR
jgi:uncharacterized protein YjiS (DUF1127 family)